MRLTGLQARYLLLAEEYRRYVSRSLLSLPLTSPPPSSSIHLHLITSRLLQQPYKQRQIDRESNSILGSPTTQYCLAGGD